MFRDLDIVEYFLVLGGCSNRANVCVGRHRITDPRRFRDLNQALHKLVVYGTLQQQPGTCNTGLARRCKNTGDGTHHGRLDVGIFKYNIGGFPAQFQRHVLECRCRYLIDFLSRTVRPGKCDFGNIRMGIQFRTHILTETTHRVDDPRGDTRFLDQVHELKGGSGCELRRFYNGRITRSQRN